MSNGRVALAIASTRGLVDRRRRRFGGVTARRRIATLLAVAMLVAACATQPADDASASRPVGETSGRQGTGREIIRFAFAPDPVWDYMRDTGVLAQWEEEHNLRIHTSETWDEFAYFAGGHGDIVSMGTYELPVLEQESGIEVVAFGKYNHARTPIVKQAEDPYETLADVPEGSTTCASGVPATIQWSVIADKLDNVDYRVGEGRFNIVIQDSFVMGELTERGECEVAQVIPEGIVSQLRSGELEYMYGGKVPWQLYQEICGCDHKGMMTNLFVARAEWYDAHPDQAAAFLELWERGIQLWHENQDEIIRIYPQHFAVESEEDIEWMVDFMAGESDWWVDSVYMDEAWIGEEKKFYDLMIETGWMDTSAKIPRFEAVPPPT
jgi:hypothetical protein